MSDRRELMDLIAKVLEADGSKKPKRAPRAAAAPPAEPEEINGIRIVDEGRKAPGRPKKTVPEPARSPSPSPRAKPARAAARAPAKPRAASPAAEVREFPKPSPALGLKRSSVRPMPHSCNCPLCPLKN